MFVDIALWRRGPQDLPASTTLAWLVAMVYALITAVQVGMLGGDFRSAVILVSLALGLQTAWLWGLLAFFAKRPRFLQSITAFLGVGALIRVLDIVLTAMMSLIGISDSYPANPWPLLQVGLILLLLGRVLQQALERSLIQSMLLTFVIMLTISALAKGLVPGV